MELKWLDPTLAVHGQIEASDIPALRSQGIRLIINNRPDGEEVGQPTSDEIAKAAEVAGIGYAHVPVAATGPTQHDAVAFAKAIHTIGGKALAFCRTGNRSAATWRLMTEMLSPRTRPA